MAGHSFNEQFDWHSAWRREMRLRVKVLADWLREQQLLDDGGEERMQRLTDLLRSDKVMVAFVAEFSRGKSELINAVFFAGYGRRIMPASAGRTTMCPTELGYEASLPPCLRLLPIETRLQPQTLLEWRLAPEKWTRVDLDMNNPAQLAEAMQKVSEVVHVTQDDARALGFWHDDRAWDNPPVNAHGAVEVPRWRHALINMAHPLLRQGLVVLDTPGLNAIGAEPELTVNLIPQAQAVVFILGADTGVTKSDLVIWREHLATMESSAGSRFVVLNKIDTLWDELSSPAHVERQIARQCAETAQTLALEPRQVLALSAQKGLLAKVRDDEALLAHSRLPQFEQLLGQQVLGARQTMLVGTIGASVARVQTEAERILAARRREVAEQVLELEGLRGKNHQVIRQMRLRVEREKSEFDRSAASVLAVRSVHLRLLRQLFRMLGSASIKRELAGLGAALREPGVKFGLRKAYGKGFDNLRQVLREVQRLEGEIHAMLTTSFRQINTDFGFSLQVTEPPTMDRFEKDLDAVERSHLQYLGVGNMVQLARPEFAERLVRALLSRVRSIFEAALGEIELWNKSMSGQLDTQMRERRRAYGRRIEAIQRIQDAASGLERRIGEITEQKAALDVAEHRLQMLSRDLRQDATAVLAEDRPETVAA
ncbi:dynamin family protein [Ottowia sp. SB7-C50]|nr:dynamin family protein [Ottowia sp. SB7-C50]WOP14688.1 dynamin family protein [Ottowia sp. SB7-C50]